ncbi:MarP family serine protease [Herbiconiux sp. CPCC 203407]|uniref:MarP family serine protease n=1 Tax=Herbiconiux oxytropis TaxID=2970915 RepID=A0AA41XGM7_9MICO|nr:MarP family serine protease [Herbiconiux oxytropis]MCS5722668.1 MarP family serine protease [Herbiconiux oxytropis]MCS5725365.1 MarP family serine protease [Herbiconiux oxytropis]
MELFVDIVLLVIALLAVAAGWRRGALVTAASLAGIVAGALLATLAAPPLVEWLATVGWAEAWQRAVAAGLVLILSISIAIGLLTLLARLLRGVIGVVKIGRGIDSLGGAVLGLLTWGVVVWLLAGLLQSTGILPVTQLVQSSKVVATLDAIAPVPSQTALGTIGEALDDSGFPEVFAFDSETIQGAPPPDPDVPDAVNAAAGSVVKVLSSAPRCGSDAEGSGWVVADDRIVTNAHVVSGSDELFVQVGGIGRLLDAELVVFDPDRDLAVLAVPGLDAAPLPLGTELLAGDSAVVAGFPENGSYKTVSSRVREVLTAVGSDIYEADPVTREIYSLRSDIRPGNSGGPLFDVSGQVVGIVFARSTLDAETGYAMTLDEAAPVLEAVSSSEPVASGACSG